MESLPIEITAQIALWLDVKSFGRSLLVFRDLNGYLLVRKLEIMEKYMTKLKTTSKLFFVLHLAGGNRYCHTNGKLIDTYNNSVKNGYCKCWNPSGHIRREGTYVKGEMEGCWKFWNDSGQLTHEGIYKHSRLIQKHYYENNLCIRIEYYGE